MTAAILVRRAAIFVVVFGAGMSAVVWAAGGLVVPRPAGTAAPSSTRVELDPAHVVAFGQGASLGPGKAGRLDRDDVAIVGGRQVPYREMSAEWSASTPVRSREPGVETQRLKDARIVLFARPTEDDPSPVARETARGVTILSGATALLRRKEGAPPSVHAEGDCVASHVLEGGDTVVLRSEVLDLRRDDGAGDREGSHVIETDRPVRIEGGGGELLGTGLSARFAGAGPLQRGRTRLSTMHLDRDVTGRFTDRARASADGATDVRIRCAGTADIEALDRGGHAGAQPWRAKFHDDVHVVESASEMKADVVVVDFVETTKADRAAGAGPTEIRRLDATGGVVVDGAARGAKPAATTTTAPAPAYHVECERLLRVAEDVITEVTTLEGNPFVRFEGRGQNAADPATTSVYEIRCKGPATMRSRRSAAGKGAPADVTLVFQGDVVAIERRAGSGEVLSEVRAPRVTVEAQRGADGRTNPRVVRAEQGATARYVDFGASAQTITAVAALRPGDMQHIALVGKPVATYVIREGASPLGGSERPGKLILSSSGRIDADLAPPPAAGTTPTGTRAAAKVTGGMKAERFDGDDASWSLTSADGDAKIGWDGAIEEMHANGDAHLWGRDPQDGRDGDLSGDTIHIVRAAAAGSDPPVRKDGAKDADAWKQLDVTVAGSGASPARGTLADALDSGRGHTLRARRIVRTDGGRTIHATGTVHMDLYRAAEGARTATTMTVDADDVRATVDPDAAGRDLLRKLTATGRAHLTDGTYGVLGETIVFDAVRGEAEAIAKSGGHAQITRNETPGQANPYLSYARGPRVRAWFDPKAKGAGSFQRAALPDGGELVAYSVQPNIRRVTTTAKGPIELTRAAASCVSDVVAVFETIPSPGADWHNDSRIDCRRLDMTFEPSGPSQPARTSERIRTLTALGTPDDPATVKTRSPDGAREAFAQAERIDMERGGAESVGPVLVLTCPSDTTSVLVHDVAEATRARCDAARFDMTTYEWYMERARVAE